MADTSRADAHEQAEPHDPIYDRLQATPEFQELKKRYLGFVVPATIAFLAWYLLYVVMSNWAHDFMSQQGRRPHQRGPGLRRPPVPDDVPDHLLYSRHMAAKVDPLARQLEADYKKEVGGR